MDFLVRKILRNILRTKFFSALSLLIQNKLKANYIKIEAL
jgi:hypothetical protein